MAVTSRTRSRVLSACVGVASVAVGLASAASPSGAAGAPASVLRAAEVEGVSGIGDPYFPQDGNGGYDVQHYDIAVERYEIASGALQGATEISALATQTLSRFNLDLMLEADSVSVNGVELAQDAFAQAGDDDHELVVTPAVPIPQGTEFTVRVEYHGVPKTVEYRGRGSWLSSDVETMATNEPHIAPWWFPANDHPRDKATFDIAVTVPAGNQAISNGELATGSPSEDGEWSTWEWSMGQPMAPYLAFFAAGKFEMETGVSQGLPYVNAVSMQLGPAKREEAMRLMRRHPAVVRWFEGLLGAYPYASTGGVTTSLFSGFALENQSRPTYPYLGNGGFARSVVVHEVAHQWFGNEVSVDRWRDIWLNEGFATWAEWMYTEGHGGRRAQRTLLSHYSAFMRSDPLWNLTIGDPGPRRLFAYPVYERGAMAVQALRHRIGNADFREVLRTWLDQRAGGTGRVGQLKKLAEDVSGVELDGFFRAWLHVGDKPARTMANGLR